MERQQQPPPETFDFKIKFAETKAHAKVRKAAGPERWGALGSPAWVWLWADLVWSSGLPVLEYGGLEVTWPRLALEAGYLVEQGMGVLRFTSLTENSPSYPPHRRLKWN